MAIMAVYQHLANYLRSIYWVCNLFLFGGLRLNPTHLLMDMCFTYVHLLYCVSQVLRNNILSHGYLRWSCNPFRVSEILKGSHGSSWAGNLTFFLKNWVRNSHVSESFIDVYWWRAWNHNITHSKFVDTQITDTHFCGRLAVYLCGPT